MPPLAEMQSAFADTLLNPDSPPPATLAHIGGQPPRRRFDVYRNNVAAGLVDALGTTYPAVRKLVGETFFRAMAREFVRAHPPRSPVLIDYGGGFAGFVETFPPAGGVPYLADVARLEWAWTRAYNAADRDPLPISALAGFPADRVARTILELHPSTHLIRSRWPVASLWAASTGGKASDEVDMTAREVALVIRPRLEVHVRVIPRDAAIFLSALLEGVPLEAAAALRTGHPGFDLSAHFAGLFEMGAVVGVTEPAVDSAG